MAECRLIQALLLLVLEPELHGRITVFLVILTLNDHARAGLNNRNGNSRTVFVVNGGHPQLFSNQSFHDAPPS